MKRVIRHDCDLVIFRVKTEIAAIDCWIAGNLYDTFAAISDTGLISEGLADRILGIYQKLKISSFLDGVVHILDRGRIKHCDEAGVYDVYLE